jgi:hypothetical protein
MRLPDPDGRDAHPSAGGVSIESRQEPQRTDTEVHDVVERCHMKDPEQRLIGHCGEIVEPRK